MRYISLPSGENRTPAKSRSSPLGQGIVLTIFLAARSYCTIVGGPISQRSVCNVAVLVTRIMYWSRGSGWKLLMRVRLLPSLSVNVSSVLRAIRSTISTRSNV